MRAGSDRTTVAPKAKGVIGSVSGGPKDLATNPRYMNGYGE